MTNSRHKPLPEKAFYSPNEAAAYIGVHRSTLERWVKQGKFAPKIVIGPARRGFHVGAVHAWIAGRPEHRVSI